MTPAQQDNKDTIDYIHSLVIELEIVEFILCISEYGYKEFFRDYNLYLAGRYKQHLADAYWNQVFDIYTSPIYSQLWHGLEVMPFGYIDEKKRRKSKKYEWWEEMYNAEPRKENNILTEIFGK